MLTDVFRKDSHGKFIHWSQGAEHFRKFVELMNHPDIDTIMLEGNHDPQSWYDSEKSADSDGSPVPDSHSKLQDMLGCWMGQNVAFTHH